MRVCTCKLFYAYCGQCVVLIVSALLPTPLHVYNNYNHTIILCMVNACYPAKTVVMNILFFSELKT